MILSEPTDPLACVRGERLIALCSRLVQIRSVNPPGGELAIADYVAGVLAAGGIPAELIPHGPDRGEACWPGLPAVGRRPTSSTAHIWTRCRWAPRRGCTIPSAAR